MALENVSNHANMSGSGQRSTTLDFKPLSDFSAKSCMVNSLQIPNAETSEIVPVFNTRDKSAQFFHTTEKREIVKFEVIYTPFNNSSGKKLLSKVKSLIEEVLTKKCKPDTATINLLRNGKTEKTVVVGDAVIIGADILIDLHDFVKIRFCIGGILAS